MNHDVYVILAMVARYFFAGLMALIVFRAWRATVIDNRRAKVLRELSPRTGCVGELIVNPGQKKRMSMPVPKEGILGSARRADIRVKLKDILPTHAHIEQREGGLLVRPLGRARVSLGDEENSGEQLFARDGDTLIIGRQRLMVVMFDPNSAEEGTERNEPPRVQGEADPFFQEAMEENPSLNRTARIPIIGNTARIPKVPPGRPDDRTACVPKVAPVKTDGRTTRVPKVAPVKTDAKRPAAKRGGKRESADFFDEENLWPGERR